MQLPPGVNHPARAAERIATLDLVRELAAADGSIDRTVTTPPLLGGEATADLATRINDLHLMSLYAFGWLPVGPLLVGLICGSGYILAAWWFGVPEIFRWIADSGVRFDDPVLDASINVMGTLNVLECAARFETRKVIYAASGGTIYGEPRRLQPSRYAAREGTLVQKAFCLRSVQAGAQTRRESGQLLFGVVHPRDARTRGSF